jgi:hypothetical protein
MARSKSAIRDAGSRSHCCSPVRFLRSWDFNVVDLALPAIRRDLGSTSSEVQFVISADAATCAVFLITGGRLGELFGRCRMFLLGPRQHVRCTRDSRRPGATPKLAALGHFLTHLEIASGQLRDAPALADREP